MGEGARDRGRRAADKFDACRKAGADEVLNPRDVDVVEALRDLTHGAGVDVAIDYVCTTATLEAGVKALGRRGRLVILGGAAQPFQVAAHDMLTKEQSIFSAAAMSRASRFWRRAIWSRVARCGRW